MIHQYRPPLILRCLDVKEIVEVRVHVLIEASVMEDIITIPPS